ncbi:MAG: hypothetical protein AAF960_11465 [Bacteroidota bacterium]
MRQYNIEKAEKVTRIKAILFTILLHFGLLYSLLYVNSDHTESLLPDFVKEWVDNSPLEESNRP